MVEYLTDAGHDAVTAELTRCILTGDARPELVNRLYDPLTNTYGDVTAEAAHR